MNTETPEFFFFANNLALDLVNTEFNDKGQRVDLLKSKADFFAWARQANQGDVADDSAVELDDILALRQALRTLYRHHCEQSAPPSEAIKTVNQHLTDSQLDEQLLFDGTALQLVVKPGPKALKQVLASIASSAAHFLGTESRYPLKACANPDCMAMFVDTSKAKKRRWCVMEICGNRAKASTHYRKTKQEK